MFSIKSFVFSPVAENTYVLHNESGDCIIVDPGCYFDHERNELLQYITGQSLRPKYLLNTHCHLDHIFGNKFVYETWGLELYLHAGEQLVLDSGPQWGLQWGLPFENYRGPLHFLRENDDISLGDDVLKVLFTPGHSPGHIAFYCAVQEFVLGGDVLFRLSVGRTDLPGSNAVDLIKSIRAKLFTLPDETIVYPGHGENTSIGFEKKHNPFVQPDK